MKSAWNVADEAVVIDIGSGQLTVADSHGGVCLDTEDCDEEEDFGEVAEQARGIIERLVARERAQLVAALQDALTSLLAIAAASTLGSTAEVEAERAIGRIEAAIKEET